MGEDLTSLDLSDQLTKMNQNQNWNLVFPECNANPVDQHIFSDLLNPIKVVLISSDHSGLLILANIFLGRSNLVNYNVSLEPLHPSFKDVLNAQFTNI